MLRSLCCAVAGLCLSSGIASAQITVEQTFSGRDAIAGSSAATEGASVVIDWEAEVRLGLLLGEPVVSVRFKYEIVDGVVTLPIVGSGGEYNTVPIRDLPSDWREGIRLIDVDLGVDVTQQTIASPYLIADVGAPGRPGEWSFNVPGSPDWDELFRDPDLDLINEDNFLDELEAQTIWQEALNLSDAFILDAELSFYHLHNTYMRSGREEYRGLGIASNRLTEGVRRSYGLDASDHPDAWRAEVLNEPLGDESAWRSRNQRLEALIDRLSDLPDELREGDNHAPYEQAVADAALVMRSLDREIASWEAEGVDPDTLEQGYEPNFQGKTGDFYILHLESSSRYQFYFVNADDNYINNILDLDSNWPITFNQSFLIRQGRQRCGSISRNLDGVGSYAVRISPLITNLADWESVDLSMVDCPRDHYLVFNEHRPMLQRNERGLDGLSTQGPSIELFGESTLVNYTGDRFELSIVLAENMTRSSCFPLRSNPNCIVRSYEFDGEFNFIRRTR